MFRGIPNSHARGSPRPGSYRGSDSKDSRESLRRQIGSQLGRPRPVQQEPQDRLLVAPVELVKAARRVDHLRPWGRSGSRPPTRGLGLVDEPSGG